jgi:hypothetical protein
VPAVAVGEALVHRSCSTGSRFQACPNWCNLEPMNAVLSPIESEFATAEEAAAYDTWFRDQVQKAIADPRPSIPHDQVMAEMRAIIAAKRKIRIIVGSNS